MNMKSEVMEQLPKPQREAVESAGYRVVRWGAARAVLQARVAKGRVEGALGDFLAHWLALSPAQEPEAELRLTFNQTKDRQELTLDGGSTPLATSRLEHALLHLPALRSFWSQELRQQHFEALRALVPQAWLLDAATVPPGAVIQGLGLVSWEQVQRERGQEGQIQDQNGVVSEDWHRALAARDSLWAVRTPAGEKLNAWYGVNDKEQVVLRTIEEASP